MRVLMQLNGVCGSDHCTPLQIVTFLYKQYLKELRLIYVFG